MLGQAVEYLFTKEEEIVIEISRWTITPAVLNQQFWMHHTLSEMAANPRLRLGDEKAAPTDRQEGLTL